MEKKSNEIILIALGLIFLAFVIIFNVITSQQHNNIVYVTQEQSTINEQNQKININIASAAELMGIDGIGEKMAERIIEYRSNNNGFKSIEELKNIKGIGEQKFEKIKPYITTQ